MTTTSPLHSTRISTLAAVLAFGLQGCGSDSADATRVDDEVAVSTPVSPVSPENPGGLADGVVTVTGDWVAPPLVNDMYTERLVVLTDLTAFVRRDSSLPLSDDQIAARLVASGEGRESFRLSLPIEPQGTSHQFGAGGGVQVFAVSVRANLLGDPFMSPYEMSGWANQLTSVTTTPGSDELLGGRILAWAPEPAAFPSGFGPDGALFTPDDPLQRLEPGWTAIDLDTAPFAALRSESVGVSIYNGDLGRDLSQTSYSTAFDRLLAELRVRYPFTAVKQLDWAGLSAEVRPLVESAERERNADQLAQALWRLGMLMGDGHVGPYPYPEQVWLDRFGASVGLRLGQTDDGDVLVTRVVEGSPAALAGIEIGARVTRYDELPVADAIAGRPAAELVVPESSLHGLRAQQLELLPRSRPGTSVSIELLGPAGDEATRVSLTSVSDIDGLNSILSLGMDPVAMPVSASVLSSGVGYVRLTTFQDDLTLTSHAWELALKRLNALDVPALIVDVRGNSGGNDALGMYMAGSFYAEPFLRSRQLAFAASGELVHKADNVIVPAPVQWTKPVAVLVDEHCHSVCEEFTAAVAHDPTHLIVGASNTGGVEAEVYFWIMPDDVLFMAPVGMFQQPDGGLFVEGTGVAPNVRVAKTRERLLSGEDYVLEAALEALGVRGQQE